MYQRIVVPVDKSTVSQLALTEAIRLCNGQGVTLRLIHVVDSAQFSWADNEFVNIIQLQQEWKVGGQGLLDALAAELINDEIKVETALIEVLGQTLSESIIEEATRWGADLIVMGTHGHSGLMHLLLGSVAEGVIRASSIPVLLVPHKLKQPSSISVEPHGE